VNRTPPKVPRHPEGTALAGAKSTRTAGGFDALAQTTVYRKLPIDVRTALDTAILTRPDGGATLTEAHRKLRLGEAYRLTLTDVERYAKALEVFSLPLMASVAVSSLLKALPRHLARGLNQANRLVIWSRLVQHLTDAKSKPLKATEYAKLAEMLRPPPRASRPAGIKGPAKPGMSRCCSGPTGQLSTEEIEPLARALFGVTIAKDPVKAPRPPRGDDPPGSSDRGRG
jgi:hypothetical protein